MRGLLPLRTIFRGELVQLDLPLMFELDGFVNNFVTRHCRSEWYRYRYGMLGVELRAMRVENLSVAFGLINTF